MTLYESHLRTPRHRRQRRPWRTALAAAIALCGVTAAATLGPALWQLHRDRAEVTAGQAALREAWDADVGMALVAGRPAPGGPIGRMTIPRLGPSWVLVEGVELWQIEAAPGHYPGTALPGQRGNAAFAAHREDGMWADLDEVQAGDVVIVETRTRWLTFRVAVTKVVDSTDLAVVAPVPPGMNPGKLLTLTTCWPRFTDDNPDKRLVVHAVLERTTPADQPPEELR